MDTPARPRAKLTENENLYDDPTVHFKDRVYLAIDLKSFYASVECVKRGLDPLTAHLVVADPTRSRGTICLAVSPAMKALGVRSRCRLYEVPERLDYIIAPPQMQHYLRASAEVYEVFLQYLSREDIFVYSVDETFMDVTGYLSLYGMSPKELGTEMMAAVYDKTGLPCACGIGTNLFLAKAALDIMAKHSRDFMGVLDEDSYRETLWTHTPITDFWMVGAGTARRLQKYGIKTMRDLAAAAFADDSFLYKEFGVDAEILIDHAFGVEPVTIADIKGHQAKSHSISSGQVLMRDYTFSEAELILKEMLEQLCLKMARKDVLTGTITVIVSCSQTWEEYALHPYFRMVLHAQEETESIRIWLPIAVRRYEETVLPQALIRRVTLSADDIHPRATSGGFQYSFLDEEGNFCPNPAAAEEQAKRDKRLEEMELAVKDRFGENALLRGSSLQEASTARQRSEQIGGHRKGD